MSFSFVRVRVEQKLVLTMQLLVSVHTFVPLHINSLHNQL
jgi:hypothetical protein